MTDRRFDTLMVKSMTGYGRSEWNHDIGHVIVEIRTINHRYLEFFLRIPKEFATFEDEIKKTIQEQVKRGRVECTISLEYKHGKKVTTDVNWRVVDNYIKAAEQIRERFQLADHLRLDTIFTLPDVFSPAQQDNLELFKEDILNTVRSATDALTTMRATEGHVLKLDAIQKITSIQRRIDEIRALAPQVVTHYQERLKSRIKELLHDTIEIDPARLWSEVVLFADKSNIDEEIVRLDSHCKQYFAFLELKEPMGRKLDFLLQEMNREINTIGSKANNLSIAQHVIEIKSDIEKLREQVQNME